MAGQDAVRATAVARREVRASLDRLEYHLGRGRRGSLGVSREIRFLDALHRQTVRVGAGAVGVSAVGRVPPKGSFGQRAARDLASNLGRPNNLTRGRMKSSLLADFSADGLKIARSLGGDWRWQANASACPSCLSRHGRPQSGAFVPLHPSCLCIPSYDPAIRPLSNEELVRVWSQYGDPRYATMMRDFQRGETTRATVALQEAVNLTREGARAVAAHDAEATVAQSALEPPQN